MSAAVDVIVIGGGVNGLAAAVVLARAGRTVAVVEAANSTGGRYRQVEFAPGFRMSLAAFDTGWVSPLVARATGVQVDQTAPRHSAALANYNGSGDVLALPTEIRAASDLIRPHSPVDAGNWAAFTGMLRDNASVLEDLYQLPAPRIDDMSMASVLPLLKLAGKLRLAGRERIPQLLGTLPMSVRDLLDDRLQNESLKAMIAAGALVNVHQGPFSYGTAFVLLHHLTGAPAGSVRARPWTSASPDALAMALNSALASAGVSVRTEARVERIIVRDYSARGVALSTGEEIFGSQVLSTVDPRQLLLELVDPEWLDPDLRHEAAQIRYRGTTGIVCFALSAPLFPAPPDCIMTNAADVASMERSWDALRRGSFADTPFFEFAAASARWPALARAGHHVVIARSEYVPAETPPADLARVAEKAFVAAFPRMADHIVHAVAFPPRELGALFGLSNGSGLSHGDLALDQVLFMRPVPVMSRYRTPIRGLFTGGSGSHPGPGVPGAAGVLAAAEMQR